VFSFSKLFLDYKFYSINKNCEFVHIFDVFYESALTQCTLKVVFDATWVKKFVWVDIGIPIVFLIF
jgi:hypothetical protein